MTKNKREAAMAVVVARKAVRKLAEQIRENAGEEEDLFARQDLVRLAEKLEEALEVEKA